jgi:signal transduction histidine kinase
VRFRTWPVAALGLCGLLVLVVVSLTTASRRAQEIYTELDRLNAHHREIEGKFRRLRSDVQLSSIFVRDYLLDIGNAPEHRTRLNDLQRANLATFSELRTLGRADGWDDVRARRLEAELKEYWRVTTPLFDRRPGEELPDRVAFLRRAIIPRREAVLALAREIEDLNNVNLAAERAEVKRRHDEFRADLRVLLWQSVFLGLFVAASAVVRLGVLERRSERERAFAEEAERHMRELSQQLVVTQEEERKKLSRELHDHVGQVLTALRMELGRIERLRMPTNTLLGEAVSESRALVDNVVRTVRDLAQGLRPSMLDDFGLQAALEWLVRDFTRRFAISAHLQTDGDFADLPDHHRTCAYRTVQEAMTNCVKHAGASRIDVVVRAAADALEVSVSDDGVGIDPARHRAGLGLRGIEERVRDLDGTVSVSGARGAGTTVTIRLPFATVGEAARARATG